MKSIVMDMRFVFLAILLAMFTQTLTTGTRSGSWATTSSPCPWWCSPPWWPSAICPLRCRPLPMPPSSASSSACPKPRCAASSSTPWRDLLPLLLRAAAGLRRSLRRRSARGAQEDVLEGDPHLHDRLHLLLLRRLPGCPTRLLHSRDHLMNHYHIEPDLLALRDFSHEVRHHLHRIPEYSGAEFKTSAYCRGLMGSLATRSPSILALPVFTGIWSLIPPCPPSPSVPTWMVWRCTT